MKSEVEPTVSLISYTPNPERVVAAAARACWSNRSVQELYATLSDYDVSRVLRKVIVRGHTSVLEHAQFTSALSGVSRVLTHQLVRHRMASYSQVSQQRISQADSAYSIPPAFRDDAVLRRKYEQWMDDARELYAFLLQHGVPKGSARYVLPAAWETRIVVTMNARSLFNLIAQRACGAEDWEFRIVATRMQQELLSVAPRIFQFAGPPCKTTHQCPETGASDACGRARAFAAGMQLREFELHRI